MGVAREGHEVGVRHERRKLAAAVERERLVVAAMEDERRHGERGKVVADVHVEERFFDDGGGDIAGGGARA